jgi:hypothetical protein
MTFPKRRLPTLPAAAIGFVTVRADRPERLALYRQGGELSNSFAQDMDAAQIAAATGLRLEQIGADMWAAFRGA